MSLLRGFRTGLRLQVRTRFLSGEAQYITKIDDRGVAMLTMNRPAVHNAFDDVLIKQLTEELKRLEQSEDVKVVVLAASGKNFSAGADLNWMKRMATLTRDQNYADSLQLGALMQTLNFLKKPTIARVQGAAFGGGVGLVACCDMAVATPRAKFCLSEVKLGLIPAVISPYVVQAMGTRNCRRYFLTAEVFSSEDALRMGLVNKVVPEEEIDAEVQKLVDTLLPNGPNAMASAKALLERVSAAPIDEELIKDTCSRIADQRVSPEAQARLAKFLEKSS